VTRDGQAIFFLLFELHRALPKKWTAQGNVFFEIMRLLEDTEGFANAIIGDSAEDLLEGCRENGPRIKFVLEIIRYVSCYSQLPKAKRTIEDAKYFLSSRPEFVDLLGADEPDARAKPAPRRGVKTLEKIWAEYIGAAPLLYALYHDQKFDFAMFDDIELAVDWTKEFCDDPARVQLFLGRATAVARMLKAVGVRSVRTKDFKDLTAAKIEVARFTPKQISFIQQMDSKAHPNDGKPFRARVKKARA
jgi:hypothetical protein